MASPLQRRLGLKLLAAVGAPSLAVALVGVLLLRLAAPATFDALGGAVVTYVLALTVGTAALHVAAVRWLVERPLARIVASLRRAEEGDFLLRVPVESADELGQLAARLNTALAAITDLHASRLDDAASMASMQRELALKAELERQHALLDEANRRLEERLRELTLLADLSRDLSSTLRLDEVLRRVVESVGRTLGHEAFALLLPDEDGRALVVKAAFGAEPAVEGTRIRLGEGVAGWAAEHRRVQLVRDTRLDPRFPAHFWTGGQGSLLAVPLLHAGACVGVFDFFRASVDAFGEHEVRFLEAVAGGAAMAVANARLHERTLALSLTDPLTGLLNRRAFEDRAAMELERSRRFAHGFAVALLDVDDLRRLVEAHGHLAGDAVVRAVADALRRNVREVDTLARLGAEEFALVLPRADRAAALAALEKLGAAVRAAPMPLPAGAAPVTASAGIAVYPHDAGELGALLARADAALTAAQRGGKDRVVAHGGPLAQGSARP